MRPLSGKGERRVPCVSKDGSAPPSDRTGPIGEHEVESEGNLPSGARAVIFPARPSMEANPLRGFLPKVREGDLCRPSVMRGARHARGRND